jgi:hypothetical protein
MKLFDKKTSSIITGIIHSYQIGSVVARLLIWKKITIKNTRIWAYSRTDDTLYTM